MATIITAPPYSFVQLSDNVSFATCYPDPGNCLPANNVGSVNFQLLASGLSDPPLCFMPVRNILAYPVRPGSDCDNYSDIPDVSEKPLVGRVENQVGDTAVFCFDTEGRTFEGSPLADGIIEVGQCYKYKIIEYWTCGGDPEPIEETITVLGCTNCFRRIEHLDLCYLSAITYTNKENAYGFIYDGVSPAFTNQVLLPFYLKNPQLASKENRYRRSDGSYIKLSERVEEEYILETDTWRHQWHRNFKLALGHDEVEIANFNIGQQAFPLPGPFPSTDVVMKVVCKDDYQIDWPEDMPFGASMLAKAKTKITLSEPVVFINSNCG